MQKPAITLVPTQIGKQKDAIQKHRTYAMAIIHDNNYLDASFTTECRSYWEGYLKALADIEKQVEQSSTER